MSPWILPLCALLAVFSSCSAQDWGYRNNGPSRWADGYPQCGTANQSPIALYILNSQWYTETFMRENLLKLELRDYNNAGHSVFYNDGLRVYLGLHYTDPQTTPRIVLSYNGTDVATLYLRNITFHWPAEHRVDNKRYELEVQMHHTDETNSSTWALSYLYEFCVPNNPRSGIDRIMAAASAVSGAGSSTTVDNFVPQTLMPVGEARVLNMCNYVSYGGSLTTPPCGEIAWFVSYDTLCITRGQLRAFQNLRDSTGARVSSNARPLQPHNNRTIISIPCEPY